MTNEMQAKVNATLIIVMLLCLALAIVIISSGNVFFYVSVISFSIAFVMKIWRK